MVCVYCSSKTRVVNSRLQKSINGVWRRRQCLACKQIFTTRENAELESSIRIQYPDGSLRPFLREVLFVSIYESCRHRPTAISDACALTNTVVTLLLAEATEDGLLAQTDTVKVTKQVLNRFDRVAGTVYTAYHPNTTVPTSRSS